ncbi:MAG: polysaccharide deacetylase family protein [Myxococcales bacterium]
MIASVSVDLDGLACYSAIHGIDPSLLDERALRAVPEVAIARLCELFAGLGIQATFFVIGSDLKLPYAAASVAAAARAGHEIASHSHAHDYALSRLGRAAMELDLTLAEEAIRAACGAPPRGFRAPGYTLSPELLDALTRRGYAYDSSLLPSPAYYAAKAFALALYATRGRRSESILGSPGQLFAPRSAHWRSGIRELPVATLPLLRAPVIGTVLAAVPASLGAALVRAAGASGHLNLELHAIDVLDASDGAPALLAAAQPGLSIPAAVKLRRLREVLAAVRERAEVCTLEAAAPRLLPAVH